MLWASYWNCLPARQLFDSLIYGRSTVPVVAFAGTVQILIHRKSELWNPDYLFDYSILQFRWDIFHSVLPASESFPVCRSAVVGLLRTVRRQENPPMMTPDVRR